MCVSKEGPENFKSHFVICQLPFLVEPVNPLLATISSKAAPIIITYIPRPTTLLSRTAFNNNNKLSVTNNFKLLFYFLISPKINETLLQVLYIINGHAQSR